MQYIIETNDLTKRYGKAVVVNRVNLHIPKGKVYGLLGRNGAGKTTIMKMMLQLVHPSEGTILLFNQNYKEHTEMLYRNIGSMIETPGFYQNLTAWENLRIIAKLRGHLTEHAILEALQLVNLDQEKSKVFADYSLGMKQRLGIAAAIMHKPDVLILDEPMNGLDPIGISELRTFLSELSKRKGITILISSHVLSEIEQIVDIIGVMHEGCLIEEVSMEELHKRKRRYYEFEVSNINCAARVLENDYHITDYTKHDDKLIKVYDFRHDHGMINKSFVEHGIVVSKVNISEDNLEDYFSTLIGGGGIA